MATTKKTKTVDWNKELGKATGKYVRAIDKLFKDFEKEVRESSRPMHLNQPLEKEVPAEAGQA